MKLKKKLKKNSIINLMIICLPLCPYKVFSIGEKDISAIFIIWGLVAVFGFFDTKNLVNSVKNNPVIPFMIVYGIFNSIVLKNHSAGSIVQFVLLWTILLLSYRRVTKQEFDNTVLLFQKVMNFMAVFGIYEFVGRLLGLPLADPWIDNHMVEGYNWYNMISVGGKQIARANGIFVEPSMFSQYLAINILLYIFTDIQKDSHKRNIYMTVNIIALLLSFSGTGILLLVVGAFVYLWSDKGIRTIMRFIKKHSTLFLIGAMAIIGVFISPIGKYLLSRLSEFDPTNTKSISGYIRFVGQFNVSIEVLKSNPVLGLGIGNVQNFIEIYRFTGGANAFASLACSMIVARYAAELGIIGLFLLIILFKSFITKERLANQNYKILLISLIIMIPLCDSGISVNYWFLFYLINIDFHKDVRVSNAGKRKKCTTELYKYS